MRNSESYYKLPTIRKMRRRLRRQSRSVIFENKSYKALLILRDINGANILKTRRWLKRIKKTIITDAKTMEDYRAKYTNN